MVRYGHIATVLRRLAELCETVRIMTREQAVASILKGVADRGIDVSSVHPTRFGDRDEHVFLRIGSNWPTILVGPRGGVEVIGYRARYGYASDIEVAIHTDIVAACRVPKWYEPAKCNLKWYQGGFRRSEEIWHRQRSSRF